MWMNFLNVALGFGLGEGVAERLCVVWRDFRSFINDLLREVIVIYDGELDIRSKGSGFRLYALSSH